MKLYSASIVIALITAIFIPVTAAADGFSVGPNAVDYDFTSIQTAVDYAPTGSSISIAAGTYSEDVRIAGKHLIISGSALNTSAVVIEGQISVWPEGDLELANVGVDASGRTFAVKVYGRADIRYGLIYGGNQGVVVEEDGYAYLYELEVAESVTNCVFAAGGEVSMQDFTASGCGNAGVRSENANPYAIRLVDSEILDSRIGVVFLNQVSVDSDVWRVHFEGNGVAIKVKDSTISFDSLSFADNGQKLVFN